MCACYELHELHDIDKFKEIYEFVCNTPCGSKHQELVHAHWEHVGIAIDHFLQIMNGFEAVSHGAIKFEKSNSQRYYIAFNLCLSLEEIVLMTQACLSQAHHQSFLLPNFSWLKIKDSATKVSGHASRHVCARVF